MFFLETELIATSLEEADTGLATYVDALVVPVEPTVKSTNLNNSCLTIEVCNGSDSEDHLNTEKYRTRDIYHGGNLASCHYQPSNNNLRFLRPIIFDIGALCDGSRNSLLFQSNRN